MAKTITIDFETRSALKLKGPNSVGMWAYAEHPTTDILCMSFKYADALPKIWFPKKFSSNEVQKHFGDTIYSFQKIAFSLLEQDILIEAHNAEFERAIWYHICTKRLGWPEIPIKRWRCSAAKSRASGLPGALDEAGAAQDLPITKDRAGHKLMLRMCKPRQPRKAEKAAWFRHKWALHGSYSVTNEEIASIEKEMPLLWNETPEEIIRLGEYCIQDVEAERCLSKSLRPLSDSEQRLWFLDQEINTRGVYIDTDGALAALELVGKQEDKLLKEVKAITGGAVRSTSQTEATKKWLAMKGVEIPNLQKATVESLLSDPFSVDFEPARRLLEIRQSLSKSSTKKFNAMLRRVNKDSRARGIHIYHGASPGRWAGSGIQTQNMPRPEFTDLNLCVDIIKKREFELIPALWGSPARVAASCVRSMVSSAPGYDFICGDFSSIEAIILAWLAKEYTVLEAFKRGDDIYKLAATTIYGATYDEITKTQRQVGKVAVLALGYQGSVVAFQDMAVGYNVDIPDELVKQIVDSWRAKHVNIRNYWRENEYAAMRAVRTGKPISVGAITWGMHKDFLFCKLPSGRLMAYYRPEIKTVKVPWGHKEALTYMGYKSAKKNTSRKWMRVVTYGGKLVENIVQATARDMLVGAMFRVEVAEYRTVMHVHDEILSEVPEGFGSVEEFEAIMSVPPAWAEDCPIGAKAWRGKRYKK